MQRCPNCQRPVDPDSVTCDFCNEPIEKEQTIQETAYYQNSQQRSTQKQRSHQQERKARSPHTDNKSAQPASNLQNRSNSRTEYQQRQQVENRPNFLLDDEKVISTFKIRRLFGTSYEYYLTDKRVVETTSDLSSSHLIDIPLEKIISIDEKDANILATLIFDVIVIAAGVFFALYIPQGIIFSIPLVLFVLFISVLALLQSGFEIKTANPDVSMQISSRRSGIQDFIREVRKESRRD
jgi:hypothetical protein